MWFTASNGIQFLTDGDRIRSVVGDVDDAPRMSVALHEFYAAHSVGGA